MDCFNDNKYIGSWNLHQGKRMMKEYIWGKILTIAITIILLSALGLLIYVTIIPLKTSLTEFYILNLDHKAYDYPQLLSIAEEGKVIVHITNKEFGMVTYWTKTEIDGITR